MKRKFLALILSVLMLVSLMPTMALAAPAYGDTDGHWAESSIERWSGYGIVQGADGMFDPNGQLTCAQLATILVNLLKLPAAPSAGFTDNPDGSWFADAINRCAAAGILLGNGDGTVAPTQSISRDRTMVMLARALGVEPVAKPDLSNYSDAAKVAPYAAGYVAALVDAGVVNGLTETELAPQEEINRASTVTILDKAISTYADKDGATVNVTDGKGITLIVADNVTVKGTVETLVVASSDANVKLDGVTAEKVAVTGEGNKVELANSKVETVVASGEKAAVATSGKTTVETVSIAAADASMSVGKGSTVETLTVTEAAANAEVKVASGASVQALETAAEKTTVNNSGVIATATIAESATGTEVKANSGSYTGTVKTEAADTTVGGTGAVAKVEASGSAASGEGAANVTTQGTTTEKTDASGATSTDTNTGKLPATDSANSEAAKDAAAGTGNDTPTATPSTPSGGGSYHSHSYTYTDNGDGTHTGKCSANDSTLDPAAHTYTDGKCAVCGAEAEGKTASLKNIDNVVSYYDTLAKAIADARAGDTVYLLEDLSSGNVWLKDGVTLNLGGHTIDANGNYGLLAANGIESTVKNGTITNCYSSLVVFGTEDKDNPTVVTVDKDVTIENTSYGIIFSGYHAQYKFTGYTGFATLNFNGTINAGEDQCAIFVMGNLGNDSASAAAIGENGNQINIGASAKITATHDAAIVLNGMAKLTVVDGATIEGADAITMKRGYLDITGGTFKGTGTKHTPTDAEHSGAESSGSAITVSSTYNYSGVIDVKISGGIFTSTNSYGFYAGQSVEGGQQIAFTNTNFAISSGTFTGGNGGVYFATGKHITGGTFSSNPSAYVAPGYKATKNGDVWEVACIFASGSGTQDDPFQISDLARLKAFRDSVNAGTTYSGKYIKLTTDINLNNEEWLPIGEKAGDKFSGTFDGQNHKIEGLSITATQEIGNKETFDGYAGFFGAINGGTVKNLSVYGSVNSKNAAGVVARVDGNSSVINCHNYATVTATDDGKAGGVICLTNKATISVQDCTNSGTVSGGQGGTAGIIGYANAGVTVSGCKNNGNIGNENSKFSGGIVGYATGDNATESITKCSNSGIIVAHEECGGIVGIITGSQNVSDCTNTQSVKGTDTAFSGGIVGGFAGGTIKDCTNTASVHGKFAGGVVGSAQKGVIENCSGGTAAITSPVFTLGFTGQTFTLKVAKNQAAGRILGTNQGSGSNNYTVLKLANNENNQAIGTVGMCGNLTTWANLKISSGTFYGEPLAGNRTYITLEEGATWGDKTAGTYHCGGLTESSRIATWQIKN